MSPITAVDGLISMADNAFQRKKLKSTVLAKCLLQRLVQMPLTCHASSGQLNLKSLRKENMATTHPRRLSGNFSQPVCLGKATHISLMLDANCNQSFADAMEHRKCST